MYHFVYETTNLVNGKKYIGKHSSEKLDDDYLGSGIALRRAVDKYGSDSFKREILKQFDSSEEAFEYEAKLVTEEIVNDNNYYNMTTGGFGGNIIFTEDVKAKMRESSRKRFETSTGTTLGKVCYTNGTRNIFVKAGSAIPEGFIKGISTPNRKSRIGCEVKPTTIGTFWVNNGTINKLIQPGNDIPEGFIKGRLMKRNAEGKFSKVK